VQPHSCAFLNSAAASRCQSVAAAGRASAVRRKHTHRGHQKPCARTKSAGKSNTWFREHFHVAGFPDSSCTAWHSPRSARAIAVSPEIILMDEPCSALDPIATAKVEELIDELKANYCIVIVTHSMAQAARVSQQTAFFHLGKLVETGPTETVFTNPREPRTQDYITGRFG
jgi:hypothetical protein